MSITTITTESGRTIHIVPDGQAVFTLAEIAAMKVMNISKESAEYLAMVKEVFKTSAPITFTLNHQEKEQVMAFFNFTPESVEETSFDTLPAGRYLAQLCNHEIKTTKSGGHMLNLTFEITGPTHVGRKLFDGLNIDNANEQAVKIAMSSFKSLCTHAGMPDYFTAFFEAGQAAESIDDLQGILDELPLALYDREVALNVVVQPAKDGYAEQNKIKAYGPPVAVSATAPPKANNGAPAPKKPAWAQK